MLRRLKEWWTPTHCQYCDYVYPDTSLRTYMDHLATCHMDIVRQRYVPLVWVSIMAITALMLYIWAQWFFAVPW